MQINRLSTGLQEELQIASHYNTARSDTLFENMAPVAAGAGASGTGGKNGGKPEFGSLDTRDLNINLDQIEELLDGFADEVIKVFSSEFTGDNPLRNPGQTSPDGQESSPTFTA